MSAKPITERQRQVLQALVVLRDGDSVWSYPAPPSRIAREMPNLPREMIQAHVGGASAGGGSVRTMNPAQRIISSLRGLAQRGLIYSTTRPDGLSGAAYGITEAGEKEAERT